MKINNFENNSPKVKIPSKWLISTDCQNQYLDLSPIDAEGDKVKCRWATVAEAGESATDLTQWPSISLDEDSCTLFYDPTKDSTLVGLKPITLVVEDFDPSVRFHSKDFKLSFFYRVMLCTKFQSNSLRTSGNRIYLI